MSKALFTKLQKISPLLFISGFIFFIVGFISFLGGIPITHSDKGNPTGNMQFLEYPLNSIEGLVVDSNGNIYVGKDTPDRVQVYSPRGDFLYSFNVEAFYGTYRIDMDEEDNIIIATARGGKRYVIDNQAEIIEETDNGQAFYDLIDKNRRKFIRADMTYYIKSNVLGKPSLVVRKPDGSQEIIISTSWIRWIFSGPYPGYIFCVIGILLLMTTAGVIFHKK